jgi:hypothetical protein
MIARSGDTNTLCMVDTFLGDMFGSTGKAGYLESINYL